MGWNLAGLFHKYICIDWHSRIWWFVVTLSRWRPWHHFTRKGAATCWVNKKHLPAHMRWRSASSWSMVYSYVFVQFVFHSCIKNNLHSINFKQINRQTGMRSQTNENINKKTNNMDKQQTCQQDVKIKSLLTNNNSTTYSHGPDSPAPWIASKHIHTIQYN